MSNFKVGNKVRSIGFFAGVEGEIENIQKGFDVENHGTIFVKITKITDPTNFSWLKVGDVEHFVEFEAEKDLQLIKEE